MLRGFCVRWEARPFLASIKMHKISQPAVNKNYYMSRQTSLISLPWLPPPPPSSHDSALAGSKYLKWRETVHVVFTYLFRSQPKGDNLLWKNSQKNHRWKVNIFTRPLLIILYSYVVFWVPVRLTLVQQRSRTIFWRYSALKSKRKEHKMRWWGAERGTKYLGGEQ
jgi:hypothetical protein